MLTLWFFRRVLVLLLILFVLAAIVVMNGRRAFVSDPLQAVGFTMCDGDPCFRGIKPGTDWAAVQETFPVTEDIPYFDHPIGTDNVHHVSIIAADETEKVTDIVVERETRTNPLPFTIGNIITRYGPPCRIYFNYTNATALQSMLMLYPSLTVSIVPNTPNNPSAFRFHSEVPADEFAITSGNADGTCDTPTTRDFGPWQGFTSLDIYRDRYLRAVTLANP
jgi:hypothetical protein